MKNLDFSLILLCAVALTSCSKPNPSPSEIETQIKQALPPWLDIIVAKQEAIEPKEDNLIINYEADISPKEELYVLDNEGMSKMSTDLGALLMPDDTWQTASTSEIAQMATDDANLAKELAKIQLIKIVIPAGEKNRIYGKLNAIRNGKIFDFAPPQFQDQPKVLVAKPKSFFPDALVTDSSEHKTAMEQITNKIKTHQAEVRQKKEKRLQEIRSAFASGKTYKGTWTQPGAGNTGQIAMTIDESDGKTFKAHLYDPEKPDQKKPAQGFIVYDSDVYQAKLVGISGQGNPHIKISSEGVGILRAMQMTAGTTNYHFLELNSAVDFQLQIQSDGTLKGEGKSGRGEVNKFSLQPKNN